MKEDAGGRLIKGIEPEGVFFLDPEKTGTAANEPEQESDEEIKPLPKNAAVLCKLAERSGHQRGMREGHQQAYEAGWSEGFEAGVKKGEESANVVVKNSLSTLSGIVHGFSLLQNAIYEESKPEIVNFCLRTCEILLRRELSDPLRHIQLIESLLMAGKALLEDVPITVYLSPEDYSSIHQTLDRYPEMTGDFQRVHFTSDETIKNGNCLIHTSLGLINFDIRRQLEDIEKKISEKDVKQES